jgi:hypothetical protein
MHSDEDLYTKFKEIFGLEPNPTKAEIMKKIGKPLERMNEMFACI